LKKDPALKCGAKQWIPACAGMTDPEINFGAKQ